MLYYINAYKKWWKTIVLLMCLSMFFTACFLFHKPVTYVSTVTLLSRGMEGSSVGSLRNFLGLTGISAGSSNDIIVSILKSRRMENDIRNEFNLGKKPKFRYKIEIKEIPAGMAIYVKGSDPSLVQEIADFSVQNLDKINTELDITPAKPMVKVLDPAMPGFPESKLIHIKMLVAGLLSFLLISLYVFFSDYLKKLKSG